MRMRPARPLDPPLIATTPKDKKDRKDKKDKKGKVVKDGEGEGDEKKKTKKRKKVPDVRARRKTIDPVKYGSSHVIGAFLGGGEGDTVAQNTPLVEDEVSDSDESSSSSSSEEEDDHDAKNDHPDTALKNAQLSVQPPPPTIPSLSKSTIPVPSLAQLPPPPLPAPADTTPGDELTAEKLKSLNLLRSMFGEDEGQEDWGGAESMSDVDMDVDGNEEREVAADGDGEEYEVVRRDGDAKLLERKMDVDDDAEEDEEEEDEEDEEDEENEDEEDEEPSKTEQGTQEKKGQPGVQITKLKDLFAPREEEGSSSPVNLNIRPICC